jgi:pimeloyl-ACP methyl ester carboxylesterase
MSTEDRRSMRSKVVHGSDGVRLQTYEWGPLDAPAILLIHGWSQSHLSWKRQFQSSLAERYRLVAYDLRGHGASEYPRDEAAYTDATLWADDVAAIIEQLGLERPVLVGWSFGGYVVCDYLRAYGQDALGGVHFVCWAVMLGNTEKERALTGQGFHDHFEGSISADVQANIDAMRGFIRVCVEGELAGDDLEELLAFNMMVPPYVRRAVATRGTLDNSDLLRTITLPVLVTQGEADRVTRRVAASHIVSCCPNSRESVYRGVGHSPFMERPDRFNDELAAFVDSTRR